MKKLVFFLLWATVATGSISTQVLAQGFSPIRINSAGGVYTDSQGRVWSADTDFTGGNVASVSGRAIANTVDDVLYQSERWGRFSYTFTVPAGSYQLTLKFAETVYRSIGQRVFNVAINGTTVLANFDIIAAAGAPNTAVDRTFTVNAGSGSNNLRVQFIHVSGQPDDPKVDAIDVESGIAAPSTPTAPNITTQPVSQTVVAGQTATFSVAATGTAPLSYQWRRNGANISGATSSTYTTLATASADNGALFSVVVSNSTGSATSSNATLTLTAATRLLSANPTSLSFGSVSVSLNSVLTTTLTNAGNSNVTISNVSISGAGINVSGVSTGQIIAPGQSAILSVAFLPALRGSVAGSTTITSNASNSPTTISLSGTGVLLVTHSATLSWTASTSSVTGYNIYSGAASGGPYSKITASPVAAVTYRDSTVQPGKTYYYVVTAVNSSSAESVYSNQASAVIP